MKRKLNVNTQVFCLSKQYLNVKETMQYLDCCRSHVYYLIQNNQLQTKKNGKVKGQMILKQSIENYMKKII